MNDHHENPDGLEVWATLKAIKDRFHPVFDGTSIGVTASNDVLYTGDYVISHPESGIATDYFTRVNNGAYGTPSTDDPLQAVESRALRSDECPARGPALAHTMDTRLYPDGRCVSCGTLLR